MLRTFALVVLVVAVAACSRNGAGGGTGVGNLGPGGGAPGSQQEFLVSVGDRVFFETDSSSLTPTAMATLDKQAVWLNRYTNYRIMIEGHADETRHPRVQYRAGRPPRLGGGELPGFQGRAASGASIRSRSARSVRWRSATIFRAGHKTAALSRSYNSPEQASRAGGCSFSGAPSVIPEACSTGGIAPGVTYWRPALSVVEIMRYAKVVQSLHDWTHRSHLT